MRAHSSINKFLALIGLCTALSMTARGQASGVGTIWSAPSATLQNAAVANGNGTAFAISGTSSALVTVNCSVACSGGTTITFQISQDGANYAAVNAQQVGSATVASTVVNQGTTATIWRINTAGASSLRAPISAYSAGTITVTATAIVGSESSFETQPISAASLPLPSGAATSANQCASNCSVNQNQVAGSSIATAATGIQKVGTVGNAGAAYDQAPGSAAPANAVQIGGTDGTNTRVPYLDPCAWNAWTYYVVNVSANTQIVAGSASKNVYICKEYIQPVAGAANVELVESATSGNACATSPTGMMGGATAATGATLATNGGFVLPADQRAWAKTATSGDAACIFTSAAVTGVIAYVQQ